MVYLSPLTKQWLLDRRRVDDAGCWLWTMSCDRDGYGRMAPNSTGERAAHRVAWALFRGPIPDDLTVDHKCFTRSCVNPDHLQLLGRVENCSRQRSSFNLQESCGQGHADFYVAPNGRRTCRPCGLAAVQRYRQRKRDADAAA